jgi:hypothetical protein
MFSISFQPFFKEHFISFELLLLQLTKKAIKQLENNFGGNGMDVNVHKMGQTKQ